MYSRLIFFIALARDCGYTSHSELYFDVIESSVLSAS